MREQLQKRFFKACLDLEANTGADVFFDRSPHVCWVSAKVYAHGWESDLDADFDVTGHYDEKGSVERAIERLKGFEGKIKLIREDKESKHKAKIARLKRELEQLEA